MGKGRVVLKSRRQRLEIQCIDVAFEDDDVRIAEVDEVCDWKQTWDRRRQSRPSHGDANEVLRIADHDLRANDARIRLERNRPREAGFVEPPRRAADTVAAHLGLRAVGVDRQHADVRARRRFERDEAVRPDAGVTIACPASEGGQVAQRRNASIQNDEIVVRTVHLGQWNAHHPRFADHPSFSRTCCATASGCSHSVAGSPRNQAR